MRHFGSICHFGVLVGHFAHLGKSGDKETPAGVIKVMVSRIDSCSAGLTTEKASKKSSSSQAIGLKCIVSANIRVCRRDVGMFLGPSIEAQNRIGPKNYKTMIVPSHTIEKRNAIKTRFARCLW